MKEEEKWLDLMPPNDYVNYEQQYREQTQKQVPQTTFHIMLLFRNGFPHHCLTNNINCCTTTVLCTCLVSLF